MHVLNQHMMLNETHRYSGTLEGRKLPTSAPAVLSCTWQQMLTEALLCCIGYTQCSPLYVGQNPSALTNKDSPNDALGQLQLMYIQPHWAAALGMKPGQFG